MATITTARDQASPALHKAQEALTDTVLPALRDTLVQGWAEQAIAT